MENQKGKSSTRAKNKYNSANYDRFSLIFPKGKKEAVQEFAKTKGYSSLNEFINKTIDEAMTDQ